MADDDDDGVIVAGLRNNSGILAHKLLGRDIEEGFGVSTIFNILIFIGAFFFIVYYFKSSFWSIESRILFFFGYFPDGTVPAFFNQEISFF